MKHHPEVQRVVDYPDTMGKKIAMQHYYWHEIEKHTEILEAGALVRLARLIDSHMPNYRPLPTCALMESLG